MFTTAYSSKGLEIDLGLPNLKKKMAYNCIAKLLFDLFNNLLILKSMRVIKQMCYDDHIHGYMMSLRS